MSKEGRHLVADVEIFGDGLPREVIRRSPDDLGPKDQPRRCGPASAVADTTKTVFHVRHGRHASRTVQTTSVGQPLYGLFGDAEEGTRGPVLALM